MTKFQLPEYPIFQPPTYCAPYISLGTCTHVQNTNYDIDVLLFAYLNREEIRVDNRKEENENRYKTY